VWMAARIKSETARIIMIWWCRFTFITSGYEHSIANMCGLMLGLLIPYGENITWLGYGHNVSLATLGNTVGGAFFVAGLYWMGSPKAREKSVVTTAVPSENNGHALTTVAAAADGELVAR
jgi:nitrite transporter